MTDDELLAELRSLLRRRDPVPESVYACAEAAFLLASLEDGLELLELVADPVLVRAATRTFRFQGKEIRIEVRLTRLPWGARLDGVVTPPTAFEVRWPGGARLCRPDAAGVFRLDELPNQPLRIRLGSLVTQWFWA
jgi:hypothetical protein